MRRTTLEIDDELVAQASAILRTRDLETTLRRALEEVVARSARRRFTERLHAMRGLDLDDPELMASAWR